MRNRFTDHLLSRTAAIAFPILLATVIISGGWVQHTPKSLWPDGTVTLTLELGTSPTYSDGTNPDSSVALAAQTWNPNMARVQLKTVDNSTKATWGNSVNDVSFSSTVYGQTFGTNVIAMTLWRSNNGVTQETDVIFNTADTWDSYRGALRANAYDIRRVALHEFGHVLGLGHPDEHGQNVSSIMNSVTSNTYTLTQDDKDGIGTLYGFTTANPVRLPTISSQPVGQSVPYGSSATFSVTANGTSPLTYQWIKDGTAISGATDSKYTISGVTDSDGGSYSVTVTNVGGSVTSSPAKLIVDPPDAPSVTISGPTTAEYGTNAEFSGSISSSATVTCQWQLNGADIAGATRSILQLSGVSPSDSGDYTLIATNEGGSSTSSPIHLEVYPARAPLNVVASGPTSAVSYKSLAQFTVTADGTPTLHYQWLHDGKPIENATLTSYVVDQAVPDDAGDYSVVVSNDYGQTESTSVHLSVLAPVPPTIINLSGDLNFTDGSKTKTLSINADGSPTFQYTWTRDGTPISSPSYNGSLNLDPPQLSDDGVYQCTVSNDGGSATSDRMLVRLIVPGQTGQAPSVQNGDFGRFFSLQPAFNVDSLNASSFPLAIYSYASGTEIASSNQYGNTLGKTGIVRAWYATKHGTLYSPTFLTKIAPTTASGLAREAVSTTNGGIRLTESTDGSLFATDPQDETLLRYDFDADSWKTVFTFSSVPTALCADTNNNLFVAAGSTLYGISAATLKQTSTANIEKDVADLISTPGGLYATTDQRLLGYSSPASRVELLNTTNPSLVASAQSGNSSFSGFVRSPSNDPTAYVEAFDSTTSCYQALQVNHTTGSTSLVVTPKISSTTPYADSVFVVSPDGKSIFGSGGDVYTLSDPNARSASIGPSGFSDLAFLPDGRPLALTGDRITVFSANYVPELVYALPQSASRIFCDSNGKITIVFPASDLTDQLTVKSLTIGDFKPANHLSLQSQPAKPSEPPLSISLADDGTVLLLGSQGRSLFRWSPDTKSFLPTINLPDAFRGIGTVNGKTTLVGCDGTIGSLSPDLSTLTLSAPLGDIYDDLIFSNGLLLAHTPDNKLLDINPSDGVTDTLTINDSSLNLGSWNPVTKRYYFRQPGTAEPYVPASVGIDGTGKFSPVSTLPLTDSLTNTDELWTVPPANLVVSSSGLVFSGNDGHLVADMSILVRDLCFNNSSFATIQMDTTGSTRVDSWDFNVNHLHSVLVPGYPDRILSIPGGGYVVVTIVNSVPVFNLLDSDLNLTSTSVPPPAVAAQTVNKIISPGSSVSFSVVASGASPLNLQWYRDGTAIAGATSATLTINNATASDNGDYTVKVSAFGKTSTAQAGVIFVGTPDSKLVNVSTRGEVGTGENALIAGFVVQGSTPKQYLIRAVGPSLNANALPDRIDNPEIELHDSSSTIATDTDWATEANATDITSIANQVGAQPLNSGSHDAAILTTLKPGAYTAVVDGVNSTKGIALVEVYDVTPSDTDTTHPHLVNISTRGHVGTGDQVLIAGFVIHGNGPEKVLIRAVGPTLSTMGVTSPLADPILELYDGQTKIAENDNWSADTTNESNVDAAIRQVGAFSLPFWSKDAALVTTLLPGNPYTVIVRGVNGATGVALVEVYGVPAN